MRASEDEALYRGEVDATALREAVVRLVRLGRRGAHQAVALELRSDGIAIEWSGVFEELEARGEGEAIVGLTPAVFTGIARAAPRQGPVLLAAYGDGRFELAGESFGCEVLGEATLRRPVKPASPLDLLMLHFQQTEQELNQAGVARDVEQVRQRAHQSVIRAAAELSWLEIDAALLGQWVEEYLRLRAAPLSAASSSDAGLRAEPSGQVLLFGEPGPEPK